MTIIDSQLAIGGFFERGASGAAPRAPSERELIEACQSGSEQAMEELFRLHWPKAHRAAYLVTRDAAAAEDIAQESFLAALRNLERFDRGRPFGPWIHRIVVNRAIDWSRARKLRREVGAEEFVTDVAASDDGMPDGSADLAPLLSGLSAEHRAVVVLRYLLDFTPGEIADVLGLPRGTVNSRLRRALDQLAGEMGTG